jgi:hypothetical protein
MKSKNPGKRDSFWRSVLHTANWRAILSRTEQRALLETKRNILRKLEARLGREHFSSL